MGKAKYHLNRVFTVLKILQAPVISPDSGKQSQVSGFQTGFRGAPLESAGRVRRAIWSSAFPPQLQPENL